MLEAWCFALRRRGQASSPAEMSARTRATWEKRRSNHMKGHPVPSGYVRRNKILSRLTQCYTGSLSQSDLLPDMLAHASPDEVTDALAE